MDASPEKRVPKKTSRLVDWEADRAKSRANVETRARNKNVQEEEKLLVWEEEQEEEAAGYVEESPAHKAPKQKAPAKNAVAPRSSSPPGDDASGTDEEEARNIAQVRADKARFLELKFMIFGRNQIPLAELELLDLSDLEKRWKDGPAKSTKGKGKLPDALPKKKSGALSKKAANKTPAKVRVTKKSVSKVSMLDSPLVAFNQAKEQSMRAESTPVPAKRTQDTSGDRDSGAQHPRLDLANKSKISRMSAPAVKGPSFDNPVASATTSHASSRVPSAAPSRSQSIAPSHPVPRGGYADSDGEAFDLNLGHDEADTETGNQAPIMKPAKKRGKQPKPRAKKGDITDPQEKALINRTVEETVALLVTDMCASTDETEIKIAKAWVTAVKRLEMSVEQWQMTEHNLAVVKLLIGGFRLRGRQRTIQIILSHFDLHCSPEQNADDVKKLAAKLLPIEFLRDPSEDDEDAGNYQSPIIARVIAAIWFTAAKPVTSRYPNLLNPVPVDVIAFVCALMQDILKRLAKDGYIKVEKQATTEEEKQKKEEEKARLKAIAKATGVKPEASETRAAIDPVRALMPAHYANLAVFQQVMGPEFDNYRAALYKNAYKWAGKQAEDSDEEEETETRPVSGVLTAASFAGDLRNARAQKTAPPTSDSRSQSGSKSTSKQKVRPQPSSRLSDDEQRPGAGLKSRRPSSHPVKDCGGNASALSDAQAEESTGGASTGAPAKERVPAGTSGKGHHEETDGGIREANDTDEPGETRQGAEKRKSRKELAADDQGDQQAGSASEDEHPVKKPRLHKKSTSAIPESDEEQDRSEVEPGQGKAERELQARGGTEAVEQAADVAQSLPSSTAVSGIARPSSPLSESPESPKSPEAPTTPDDPNELSAPKRATRLSSRAATEAPSDKAPMLVAIEKLKKANTEKHERAAQKKKEEQELKKADDAKWEEMERKAKGPGAAKPKAGGKRKKRVAK
ncbi:hypothetical protein RhiJN_01913 [Ceratobasidium sp. AG-Ba]|nr:hypothetical protein RhiJN_01913 [Ceratobasidium sp. AG-Ba]